jgi:hypothetical protein
MNTKIGAIFIWAIYSLVLLKFTMIAPWGTIEAGIGDLPIEGHKVAFVSLLPYLAISWFVWNWSTMSRQGFVVFCFLIAWIMLVGPTAYIYILRLEQFNRIVQANNTWIYFSLSSFSFGCCMHLLYKLRHRIEAGNASPNA